MYLILRFYVNKYLVDKIVDRWFKDIGLINPSKNFFDLFQENICFPFKVFPYKVKYARLETHH